MSKDFLFRGDLRAIDPAVAELINHETARQIRKLILDRQRIDRARSRARSVDVAAAQLVCRRLSRSAHAHADRRADPRLRRAARLLSPLWRSALLQGRGICRHRRSAGPPPLRRMLRHRPSAPARIFVNVQPLSGAPANNAVYEALVKPGDVVMGLSLIAGGHLTHGSPVNRSGKHYKIVSYDVDPATEQLNYDKIRELALANKPKMIIAGYTSYPYAPDWKKFRDIADEVGAYLLADISHVSGLVIAGAYPSPLGLAHVISFTTHKTLSGPRGAVLLTLDEAISRKTRSRRLPRRTGRPAHQHHCRTGRRLQTRADRSVQAVATSNGEERRALCQGLVRSRHSPRLWRHEFAPLPDRLQIDQGAGRHAVDGRYGRTHSRSGRHRGESQHHSGRYWRRCAG